VLFDLDGTLADTVDLILRCYRHTMTAHLGEAPPDERWLAGIGTPLRTQLAGFARDDAEADAMLDTYVRFQRTIHDDMVVAYPGAVDLTRALADAGVAVGVVTSKRREMAERTLARCGLADAYQVLVAADDVTRGKPDPEPVWQALDVLGLRHRADRTLFVGDSPFDIKAGRRAGTRTAAALWGPFERVILEAERPDFWVDRLEDVLTLR
jgi:pyrophosphatase PpaX